MDVSVDPPEASNKRHKCSACYQQYKKKEHLIEHMKVSYHSYHQPRCGVCQKHCKSFESLREHLIGPLPRELCSMVFAEKGCELCLKIFDSPTSLCGHKGVCRLPVPPSLETKEMEFAPFHTYTPSPVNDAGKGPEAIAMDCEMVGGGSDGSLDLCARVCLIDEHENLIFHTYVRPQIVVTNYRYEITGLTEEHLRDAMPLKEVQERILKILYNGESIGKARLDGGNAILLVGHGLENDLDCLKIHYPDHLLRDTAKYRPLMKTNLVSHSLKYLTRTYLGYNIQSGKHDPYEDCVSAMRLYKRMRGQDHRQEGVGTSTAVKFSETGICTPDNWESSELGNLTPDELYEMSRPDYRCWCLDLRQNMNNLRSCSLCL